MCGICIGFVLIYLLIFFTLFGVFELVWWSETQAYHIHECLCTHTHRHLTTCRSNETEASYIRRILFLFLCSALFLWLFYGCFGLIVLIVDACHTQYDWLTNRLSDELPMIDCMRVWMSTILCSVCILYKIYAIFHSYL